MLSLSH